MNFVDMNTLSLFDRQEEQQETLISPQEQRSLAMKGSPAERSEFVRSVPIQIDSYRMAIRFMEGLLGRARRTKHSGGLWIFGKGGQGKTFILESFMRRHPHRETIKGRECEVLLLPFRGRPSESDILLSILLMLGQNLNTLTYKSNSELQVIAEKAMAHCCVRVILFDESQHLWLTASGKIKRGEDRLGGLLGDFLKRLYDNTGVAFVFSGTPGIEAVIRQDHQANTRWPGILRLDLFENDTQFRGVLDSLDEALPMEKKSGLAKAGLSNLIYKASQGNFRRLKNFVAEAVYLAAMDGADSVQQRHLANAYFMSFCGEDTPFGAAI